jgi:hypothetical protein
MSENLFIPLKFKYENVTLANVLAAYRQKMTSRANSNGLVSVTQMEKMSSDYVVYHVQRRLPDWAVRFFNLNHVTYQEHAKIVDNNTIEIVSEQTVGKITMKLNMIHMFDTAQNSTITTAFIKAENVPKILKKLLQAYTEKQFTNERTHELDVIRKKMLV